MEETGIVRNIVGEKAVVLVKRQSVCDQCSSSGSLCRGMGDMNEIEAMNRAGAKEGDTVRVLFKPYSYLKGTALIYGVPAICLVAGAVFGKSFLPRFFPQSDPELLSAFCGFALFIAGLLGMKILTRHMDKRTESMPVVDEVIG